MAETAMKLDNVGHIVRLLCTCMRDELDDDAKSRIETALLDGHGTTLVNIIKNLADGNAAKLGPLMCALALCTTRNKDARVAVYSNIQDLCKTPTNLFLFLKFETEFGGRESEKTPSRKRVNFGRCRRRAIQRWYKRTDDAKNLAMLVTKYQRRSGWSHLNLIRLAHVRPASPSVELILRYICKGLGKATEYCKQKCEDASICEEVKTDLEVLLRYLSAVDTVKHSHDEQQVAALIRDQHLVREHVPTWLMKSKEVWRALIEEMPMLATIKCLSRINMLGLLDAECADNNTCISTVTDRLCNEEHLHNAKIHPVQVLLALRAYQADRADKPATLVTYKPNQQIVHALNVALDITFRCLEPTHQRYLLSIDANESMQLIAMQGAPYVTPLHVAATMAMSLTRRETSCQVVIHRGSTFQPVELNVKMSLEETYRKLVELCKNKDVHVDCGSVANWAAQNGTDVDVFVVLAYERIATDGAIAPGTALRSYRAQMKKPMARMVVVTMATPDSVALSTADQDDAGLLSLGGFDATSPEIIRRFAMGQLDSLVAA